MSHRSEHTTPQVSAAEADDALRELRQQLEAVKSRMRALREGIEATTVRPANDDARSAD
jgi:hypothetical protein